MFDDSGPPSMRYLLGATIVSRICLRMFVYLYYHLINRSVCILNVQGAGRRPGFGRGAGGAGGFSGGSAAPGSFA